MDYKHGGNIHEIKREYKKEVIDFSANINPLLKDDLVKAVFDDSIADIRNYPDPDYIELRSIISKSHGVEADKITLGNGAIELIFDIPRILKPKTAVLMSPTFVEYERALKSQGTTISYLDLNKTDFEYDIEHIDESIKDKDMLFLCNPNNPTSSLLTKEDIEYLLERNENTIVVIDEAFSEFLEDESDYSVVEYIEKYNNLIILKSVTKFFSIPGLRLGYIISNHGKLFSDNKYVWNVNCIAENFAKKILTENDFIEETKRFYRIERRRFIDEFKKINNIEFFMPKANYLFFRCVVDVNLKDELLKKGILIRDCSNYRNLDKGYYRVAIKSRENNDELFKALKDVLGGLDDN